MAQVTASVEYGLHCLLWLAAAGEASLSSRDLARLQGVSHSFLAKIFPKLEKAGIVTASGGVRGGYRLARPAASISVLEVVDALEGHKPLFDCQEIRGRCELFGATPPKWATQGVCAIHAVMLRAEKAMRDSLRETSLADIATTFERKAPAAFGHALARWVDARADARTAKRRARTREPPA